MERSLAGRCQAKAIEWAALQNSRYMSIDDSPEARAANIMGNVVLLFMTAKKALKQDTSMHPVAGGPAATPSFDDQHPDMY